MYIFYHISIHSLCSILCWSTFGTNYSLKTFWVWCDKLCSSAFGNYLPFFTSPLKLCQVGWGQTHIFRFLQKYLIGFKLMLWLGHSRTFTELSISHSCCVFRSIVLLESAPSAQSEVLNALDWVFIKAISIIWCIELFFYCDESLSPLPLKNTHQHTLLLGWYCAGDEQRWFPSNMMLRIEVHQTRESSL